MSLPSGGLYATYHLLGEPFQQPLITFASWIIRRLRDVDYFGGSEEVKHFRGNTARSLGRKSFQLLVGPTFVKSHDQLKGAVRE